jgi:hypothetical protein
MATQPDQAHSTGWVPRRFAGMLAERSDTRPARLPVGGEFPIALHTPLRNSPCRCNSCRIRYPYRPEHGAHDGFEHGARFEGCPGTSVEHASRRYRRLIQPATVRLPSIRADTRAGTARDNARFRRAPVQPRMRSMAVIQVDNATPIVLSLEKFVIRGIHGAVGLSGCTRR